VLAAARFSRVAWLATTMSRTAKGMAGVARAAGRVHQGEQTVGLTANIGSVHDEAALDTARARGALLPVRAVIGGELGHLLPGDRF